MLFRTEGPGCTGLSVRLAALALSLASCTSAEPRVVGDAAPGEPTREGGLEASVPEASVPDALVEPPPPFDAPASPCNGEPSLCSRAYDRGLLLATHLSAATRLAGWATVAQNLDVATQLESDVTALELAIFESGSALVVCNASCEAGSTPLRVVLEDVGAFLARNTLRVVTLLVESHVGAGRLAAAFADASLAPLAYAHPGGEGWPTLQQLIDSDTRLVVFANVPGPDAGIADAGDAAAESDAATGSAPWLHPLDVWIRQTRSDATLLGQIDCTVTKGNPDAPWLMLHHHVRDAATGLPSVALAGTVNTAEVLTDRLETCRTVHGRRPTFVAIDFVDVGEAQQTVRRVNGVP